MTTNRMKYQITVFNLVSPMADSRFILCILEAPSRQLAKRPVPEGYIRAYLTKQSLSEEIAKAGFEESAQTEIRRSIDLAEQFPNTVQGLTSCCEISAKQLRTLGYDVMAILAELAELLP